MKKIFLIVAITITQLLCGKIELAAQATKFGYFDLDYTVSLIPGISQVDTLLTVYERDSLGQRYQALVKEYMVYDSLLKVRNCGMGRKTNEIKKENEKIFHISYLLQNWQQYSQQALLAKQKELLQPFLETVMNAYKEVVDGGKYVYVFKRDALLHAPQSDNLIIPVLIRLGLKVPDELLQQHKEQPKPLRSAMSVLRTQ